MVVVVVVGCWEEGSDWLNFPARWRHRIMPPGLHLCEMALVSVTPDDIDVFSLRSPLRSLTNRRAVGTGH